MIAGTEDTAVPKKARDGAWTPWAQVLCLVCDCAGLDADPARARAYPRRLQKLESLTGAAEITRPEGTLLGTCETCRCPCWVRSDVALLQEVGFKTSELDWEGPFGWGLQQTGGMCAALVFSTAAEREIVVTAMDGAFFVGEYPEGGDWEEPLREWKSEALYAERELKSDGELAQLVEECARKVIEFVRQPQSAAEGG